MRKPRWTTLLPPVAVLVFGRVCSHGLLAGPAVLHPATWPRWWVGRDPAVAAFAIVREAAMAAAWYVLSLRALVLLSRAAPLAHRVLESMAWIRVPGAARALAVAAGVGVGTVHATVTSIAAAATSPSDPPVLRYVGPITTAAPLHHHLVVVRPGDSLWSIAAETVAGGQPLPPSAEHVAAYWWQVVEINRPDLPDPANPNLLYPGDVVILPPVTTTADQRADWRS